MEGAKDVRLLKAAEIECRVAAVNEKGLSLLLYKDARVDQKILDETYTPLGWRRTHQAINGSLYCTVEVWDGEKEQWVGKQDVGAMSDYEKEKGQASDSFKRACFNWGIGRELYTAPFIWIPAPKADICKKGQKYVTSEHFTVGSIAYNGDREIIALEIVNSKGQAVYSMQEGSGRQEAQCQEGRPGVDDSRKVQCQEGRPGVDGSRKVQHREGRPGMEYSRGKGQEVGWSTSNEQAMPEPGKGRKPSQTPEQRGNQDPGQIAGQEEGSGLGKALEVVLMAELSRTGVPLQTVLDRYGLQNLSQMTPEIYSRAVAALKQTKPKRKPAGTAA